MTRVILFLGSALFAIGCQNIERPEKPENLIPREKMIDIYVESYLSNAARSVDNRAIRAYGIQLDSILYRRFSIDSIQYDESNRYYSSQLDIYEAMFDEVHERLNTQKVEIDSLIRNYRGKNKDSVNEVSEELDTTTNKPRLVPPAQAQEVDSSKN
ncbi:DUF4296 domain-containing protein [Luteirhabdus pelagi]|uniref:DUF4296 domain-containing protein n=1 Tax=Luteirhabdus pelagi TaxID=2792783 RepID=UPI00193AAC83|nr:DUF4296 domain-containing protein [Luteirhabdus pelagi]